MSGPEAEVTQVGAGVGAGAGGYRPSLCLPQDLKVKTDDTAYR